MGAWGVCQSQWECSTRTCACTGRATTSRAPTSTTDEGASYSTGPCVCVCELASHPRPFPPSQLFFPHAKSPKERAQTEIPRGTFILPMAAVLGCVIYFFCISVGHGWSVRRRRASASEASGAH